MHSGVEAHIEENVSLSDLLVAVNTLHDELAQKIDSVAIDFNLLQADLRKQSCGSKMKRKPSFSLQPQKTTNRLIQKAVDPPRAEPKQRPLDRVHRALPPAPGVVTVEEKAKNEKLKLVGPDATLRATDIVPDSGEGPQDLQDEHITAADEIS
ncbi:hypothetical protein NDU88_000235 [Pleurodeles waltl]|uniref:Uncharacterized protein n=1 Tax=Pleurodeles waltl TaxID=8319 RepID=A0AAV7TF26_PLEWA|nr:hypothetical protein NDU88_000235 [Pleurodeles waltl]